MIVAKNLTKYYGDFAALQDVSFEVAPGQVVGFLGPNGAGKSTAMKILACYHPASSGTAIINGIDVLDDPLGIRRLIGYLPEELPLYMDMTLKDYLAYSAALRKIPWAERSIAVEHAMDLCWLKPMQNKLISSLSKGYRQRTGLAMSLLHKPKLLLLDEPTVGLDPNQVREFRNLLNTLKGETTIIVNTHILSEVELSCDRVIILNHGKIIESGSIKDVLASGQRRILMSASGSPEKATLILTEMKLEYKLLDFDDTKNISTPGDFSIEIKMPSRDDDPRPVLLKKFIETGLAVKEFTTKEPHLEDIFETLTKEGPSAFNVSDSKTETQSADK